MSCRTNPYSSRFPRLTRAIYAVARPVLKKYGEWAGLFASDSRRAGQVGEELRRRLQKGGVGYVIGLCTGAHDTGVCLIEITEEGGPHIIANYEEDRIRGTKGMSGFPTGSVEALRKEYQEKDLRPEDLLCVVVTYDYCVLMAECIASWAGETPANFSLLKDVVMKRDLKVMFRGFHTAREFQKHWGCDDSLPVIGVPHHDAHAWLSYGASPFAGRNKPTLVVVIDAMGDKSSISIYLGHGDRVNRVYENESLWDSLGFFYAIMSSALGGWPMGSGEGRCMGAAAWGDVDRGTNHYYQYLREMFRYEVGGGISLNRKMVNWHRGGFTEPFSRGMKKVFGEPLRPMDYWDPEKILDFEEGSVDVELQARLDKVAAVQLVFEDAVSHVVGSWIRKVRTDQVVFTGGGSLNCLANGRMHEQFGEDFFRNEMGYESTGLKMWIPSFPGDAGVQIGAAYTFGVQNGAAFSNPVPNPYQSGRGVTGQELRDVLESHEGFRCKRLGHVRESKGREAVGELVARMLEQGVVTGLFQGAAELGLRSLGHRSILANAFDEASREKLNRYVKKREMFRPFAPMLTSEALEEFFEVPSGIREEGYEALRYMGVALNAKGDTLKRIPSVCNRDGTARVQVVRDRDDPVSHAILKAVGRRLGSEVVLNTSLNVGTPIALTIKQALSTMKRAAGWLILVVICEDGEAFLIWRKQVLGLDAVPVDPEVVLNAWAEG